MTGRGRGRGGGGGRKKRKFEEGQTTDKNNEQIEQQNKKSKGELKKKESELKKKESELKKKENELKKKESEMKKKESELKKNKKMKKEKDELKKKKSGIYFALIDDVFESKVERHHLGEKNQRTKKKAEKAVQKVCRSRTQVNLSRQFRNGTDALLSAYKLTLENAKNMARSAAFEDSKSRSSSHSTKKNTIWQNGIFGEEGQISGCELAHLVPASSDNAKTYWFVTDFLFGCKKRKWAERSKLIHGTKNENGNKIPNTGLKHAVPNKIFVAGQKTHFDYNPQLLIIPIFTVEEAKQWRNEGYDAIVLIDASVDMIDKNKYKRKLKEKRKKGLEHIASNTHIHFELSENSTENLASHADVEKAHNLIKAYTDAIIGAQRHFAPEQSRTNSKSGRNMVGDFYEKDEIEYSNTTLKWKSDHRVRKIRFVAHSEESGHPAPDPILLVSRAVVQLQRRRDIQLAAAAEPQEEDWGDDSDMLSRLAEDEFLCKRRLLQQHELQQMMMGREIVF